MTTFLGMAVVAPLFLLALALLRERAGAVDTHVIAAACGGGAPGLDTLLSANVALARLADRFADDVEPDVRKRVMARGLAALDATARLERRRSALGGATARSTARQFVLRVTAPRHAAALKCKAWLFDDVAAKLADTVPPLPNDVVLGATAALASAARFRSGRTDRR